MKLSGTQAAMGQTGADWAENMERTEHGNQENKLEAPEPVLHMERETKDAARNRWSQMQGLLGSRPA